MSPVNAVYEDRPAKNDNAPNMMDSKQGSTLRHAHRHGADRIFDINNIFPCKKKLWTLYRPSMESN